MGKIHITKGNALCGEVDVQGSKNGTLPILAAILLIHGKTLLKNCPFLSDVENMLSLLKLVGCKIQYFNTDIEIDASNITNMDLCVEEAVRMRSSVLFLGAMVARCGMAMIPYPGGCQIGKRPIDLHIRAMEGLGVSIKEDKEKQTLYAKKETKGKELILFPFPSVGATENAILAAVLLDHDVVLKNCATEPEIVELCRFLNHAGADIEGIGSKELIIHGVSHLHEVCYRMMSDRIVAGTYLFAGVMTRGIIALNHVPVEQLQAVFATLQKMGAQLVIVDSWVLLNGEHATKTVPYLETSAYPGFPTDLQSAYLACASVADGCSVVKDTIFEDRYGIVPELQKMGADVEKINDRVSVCGVKYLQGTSVCAKDLRGGSALVLAGLFADGTTTVDQSFYIHRGYEDICRDLRLLGANIYEENET